jgi:anti-anti-sigma factor
MPVDTPAERPTDPGRPDPFRARWISDGQRRIVALSGELDLAGVRGLERELRWLADCDAPQLTLDLRDLVFIDCRGLHAIAAAQRRAGSRMLIVWGSARVRRIIALCGLLATQPFVDARPDDDTTRRRLAQIELATDGDESARRRPQDSAPEGAAATPGLDSAVRSRQPLPEGC